MNDIPYVGKVNEGVYMVEGTSPTDEAFALLLLENGYDLCKDRATRTYGKIDLSLQLQKQD